MFYNLYALFNYQCVNTVNLFCGEGQAAERICYLVGGEPALLLASRDKILYIVYLSVFRHRVLSFVVELSTFDIQTHQFHECLVVGIRFTLGVKLVEFSLKFGDLSDDSELF